MNYIFVTIDPTLCEHSVSYAKRHRNTRKRGECRNGVTNWCHHNNTPTHGQITTTAVHTPATPVPPSSTTCLLHPNSPPPSPPTPTRTYTQMIVQNREKNQRKKRERRRGGKRESVTQLRNLRKVYERANTRLGVSGGQANTLLCC
ncbi:hypothetical protein Scep_013365 [Stephania cephalantha]|uniref:Uncharacterized protein n=1 Tax=Stephania cephalantha TaxID=152367 RepID=A0AAP0P7C8_9MAGN